MSVRIPNKPLAITLVGAVLLLVSVAVSQVPKKMNYQMRLTDSVTGAPKPGPHEVTLKIFEQEVGGTAVWNETHSVTADTAGVAAVILGSTDPIDIAFDGSVWLEAEVDGEIMEPRREIVSVPFAFRAAVSEDADSLGGIYSGDYVIEGEVGVVTSDMLADGSGSGLDADMLDGLDGDAFADSAHNHDDRYYKQDALNTAGSINDAGNPVDWTRLKNVPEGLADGIDDTGPGDGHSLDAADGDPVDVVFVSDDGNVGVGTVSPEKKLDVAGDLRATGVITSGNSVSIDGAGGRIGSDSGLELRVSGLHALRLEPAGDSPNVVGGYSGNIVSSGVSAATISGGGTNVFTNRVTDAFGTVGGGRNNQAGDGAGTTDDMAYATVAGGAGNLAGGVYAVVGGGHGNQVTANLGTIGGGGMAFPDTPASANRVTDDYGTVGGGGDNQAGNSNESKGDAIYATVGGGYSNDALEDYSTVAGGFGNSAEAYYGTVGGGNANRAREYSTVGGGSHNTATADYATVGGGAWNRASGKFSLVCGGGGTAATDSNSAQGLYSVVVGGTQNAAPDTGSFVGGGLDNHARGSWSTVAGGWVNETWGYCSTIGGGADQDLSGNYATIAGGYNNAVTAFKGATVSGGMHNHARGSWSTIGGGMASYADGDYSTVPGGLGNWAPGDYSFAAGRLAQAYHTGTFVWADSTDATFITTAPNQFLIRASGGVGIGTGNPRCQLHVASSSSNFGMVQIQNSLGGDNEASIGFKEGWDADGAEIWVAGVGSWGHTNDFVIGRAAPKLLITPDGNVGIGTTDPGSDRLKVQGSACATGGWNSCSDLVFKENVKDIGDALGKVLQLRGVSFSWKTGEYEDSCFPDGQHFGVIAQEVEEVLPEAVREGPDGTKAVSYAELIPVLIESVKELKAENEVLKARIDVLEQAAK
jgi:hypothetical protein